MKQVLHIFGAMNRGGAEMRTVSLMAEMRQQGVQFDYCVLSGEQGVLDDTIKDLHGEIYYCKLGPAFFYQFWRLLTTKKFDVVHSHVAYVSGFILFLAWLAGIKKRIAHFRNTTAGGSLSFIRACRDGLLKTMIKLFATDILAVCDGAMLGFWGADWKKQKRCKVIYNGFEVTSIPPNQQFWQQYIPTFNGQKVVLNVARMDIQKNHIRQCEIFNLLNQIDNNTLMVFVGKENLERKAKMLELINRYDLNDKVHFLGLQTDVLQFMSHADVLLFPSEWEGLPGVVLEAASVGLKVVGSDLPGIEEIQQHIKGIEIVKRSQSDQEWAEILNQSLLSKIEAREIIDSFASSVFLMENNVRQLYAVYAE
ncbi:glycosyltransferase [Paraglaciecola aquimarina]|uniref:Glycosyltransferase n=1 Tax=Paraglaciecola algarum TaxID=3050085 RepID=A0ABS9D780_9ALTE|nr:glycosyltransferase [Paraglaciecola sp. G1-23]MCF2947679.1 glycosyltransferase [Paraglaciecola sp. G1-23]